MRTVLVQVQRCTALYSAVVAQCTDITEAFVTAETSHRFAVHKCSLIYPYKKSTSFSASTLMSFAHAERQLVQTSCTDCQPNRSRNV